MTSYNRLPSLSGKQIKRAVGLCYSWVASITQRCAKFYWIWSTHLPVKSEQKHDYHLEKVIKIVIEVDPCYPGVYKPALC